jgi:cytochrome c oxidase cbb3-type subunit 3
MKFIHYLTSIAGVEIFPLLSLLIFFVFFTALLVYAFRADKARLKYLSELPIDTHNDQNQNPK